MQRSGSTRTRIDLLGFAAVVALAAFAYAPQTAGHNTQTAIASQSLHRGDEVELDAPPPTVVNFGCKCDLAGNVYAAYSDSPALLSQGGLSGIPISKFSLRSKQVVRYPVPTRIRDFEGRVYRLSFDVSTDGTLYALFNTGRRESSGEKMKPEFVIGRYKEDGGVDSYIPVGQIRGVQAQPLRLAVLFNGTAFLLSGTTVRENSLGSFTGLFTGNGEFVRMLTLEQAGGDPGKSEGRNAETATDKTQSRAKGLEADAHNPVSLESSVLSFSAQDGNVYLLKGVSEATLYVLSPVGEVVRHYRLQPPAPGLSPLQMAQAGAGYLFIYYGYVTTGSPDSKEEARPADVITVLNSANGQVVATYYMPPEKRLRLPACAESPQKFIFLGASEGNRRLTLTPYTAH